jgi:hypothetical protein
LQLCFGYDVGRTRLILDEGSLTKVVSFFVLEHLDRGLPEFHSLSGYSFTTHHKVEDIAIISFLNDIVSSFMPLFFESIGKLLPLVLVHI